MDAPARYATICPFAWIAAAVLALIVAPRVGRSQAANGPDKLPDIPAAEIGDRLSDDVAVGKSEVFGNVVLYPILSKAQSDVGPLVALDDAITRGQAEVREVGPSSGAGAQVGTLVIQNHGDRPVFVLAGTIVMGGKQDRQIGQDFIVGPKKTASVDAFCVEHGRWTSQRDGRATGGKFVALKQLATSDVRAAGQYERDQGGVWNKVAVVNAAHKKTPGSGTLVAAIGDAEVVKRRDALTSAMRSFLEQKRFSPWLVGYAYALGNEVRGVRWFAHRRVFDMFRTTLLNTTAVDALTAGGAAPQASLLPASAVKQFVRDVDAARDRRVRETEADNANEYAASAKAYGSKTMLRSKAAAAPAVVLSNDYVSK